MTATPSAPAAARSPLRWVLALTSTAYFMVILDTGALFAALPRMQHDLGAGLASVQWTVNAYGIAFAAGIMTATVLGDRFGRKRCFLLGLAVFTLSSAGCAVAPGVAALVAARAVQGLAAAVVLPLSMTILTTACPADRRPAMIGIYGGLAGLAVASGPAIGGLVTEGLDWTWIFWLNVPIGVLATALGAVLLPESRGPSARPDVPGVLLVSGAVVALVWGLVRANDVGWASAEIPGTLTLGALLLVGFLQWEVRTHEAMLPVRLLRRAPFAFGNLTTLFMSGATFGAAFLVTQDFQSARGFSPLVTGVRLLPFFGTPMVVSPVAGALAGRIGSRRVMVTGLTLQAVGFAWVAVRGTPGTSWQELTVALLVAGVGVSMALPTVPAVVLGAVPESELGKASGVNFMAQRFGGVLAIAVATAVYAAHTGALSSRASGAASQGFRPAMWVCVLAAAVAVATCLGIHARDARPRARADRGDDVLAAA
jgi:EmrB/QacA subfamily drug resistance transporter